MQTITDALDAIDEYRMNYPAALSAQTKDKLTEVARSVSPVERIVNFAEVLYAKQGETNKAGKKLAADLFGFATANGWHGLADADERGFKARQALLREAGEKPVVGEFPKKDEDPEPLEQYVVKKDDEAA